MSDLCPFFSAMVSPNFHQFFTISLALKFRRAAPAQSSLLVSIPPLAHHLEAQSTIKCSGLHFQQRRSVPDLLDALAGIGARFVQTLLSLGRIKGNGSYGTAKSRHVGPPARPDDEMCCPCHHGWYHCRTSRPSPGACAGLRNATCRSTVSSSRSSLLVIVRGRRNYRAFTSTDSVVLSVRLHVARARIRPAGCRSLCRSRRSCRWIRHWHRRRRWCPGYSPAAQALRRHGMSPSSRLLHLLTRHQILILIFAEVLGLYGTSSSVYKSFLVFCLSSILAACPCSPSFRPLHLISIPFLVPLSSWRYPLLSFSHHDRAKRGANVQIILATLTLPSGFACLNLLNNCETTQHRAWCKVNIDSCFHKIISVGFMRRNIVWIDLLFCSSVLGLLLLNQSQGFHEKPIASSPASGGSPSLQRDGL